MKCSHRLSLIPPSPIRKLVPFALAAKNQGVHVYHLNIGDPDIRTPDVMLSVLHNWTKNPITYEHSQGNAEFIQALKTYYHNLGFTFIKDSNIQVTSGGSEAISMAFFSLCQPGDEIIVFEPLYANYISFAANTGVTLVPVTTTIENGFHLPSEDEILKKITSKTRAILICNPNNPTGTIYTKDEIEMLVDIVKLKHLFLLSDEVYREFTYEGVTHISLFSYMQKLPEQTVVLDSLSKRYSLCGARLGCLVSCNKELMDGVLRIAQGRLSAGLIDQAMAAKLTQVPSAYIDEIKKEYQTRRDVLYKELTHIPGVVIHKPEGAFYAIVRLPVDDAETFCKWLLTDFRDNNETVMFAPAAGFYATRGMGKNEIRIAYILNTQAIVRSVQILAKALSQYAAK